MQAQRWKDSKRSTTTALELRRSVLVPRRGRQWQRPVDCKINHRWIREGRITDEDDGYPHLELRAAQLQAHQLCVVGASTDACRLCTEAWHSGFKPVLVLLKDRIDEHCRKEVKSAAATLQWNHYKSGNVQCGFRVIVTDSSHVRVSLDRQGYPVEVKVNVVSASRVSFGRRERHTQQCSFKSPVVMLERVPSNEMVDDTHVHSLSLYWERMAAAETSAAAAVTDPEFWEERYDPDCLPFATSTYSVIIPCFIGGALQMLALVVTFHFHEEHLFGLLRVLVSLLAALPLAYCCTINLGCMLGMQVQVWPTAYHVFITAVSCLAQSIPMLFKISGHLVISDFGASVFLILALVSLIALYARFVAKLRLTKWSYAWYAMGLVGTAGSYMSSIPILLAYQFLLRNSGIAAAFFLSFAFSASEWCVVNMASLSYDRIVLGQRMDGIPSVLGDQKWSLSLIFSAINMFTETTRLSTLICGAIGADTDDFLWDAATSLATALALNTLGRTGLLSTILVHIPGLGRRVCPSGHWAMHNNAKFTMGWGRFILFLGVMLGRGLLHWQWDVPWRVPANGPYGCWCWSGIVLLTFAMAFGAEVLEDLLVFAICHKRIPQPRSEIYTEVMRSRMENPKTSSPYHPRHFTVPRPVNDGTTEREGSPAAKLDWNDCVHAPSLTNVRAYGHADFWPYVGTGMIIVLTNLSIGVGSANMLGYCRPSNDFSTVLRDVFLYSMRCDS